MASIDEHRQQPGIISNAVITTTAVLAILSLLVATFIAFIPVFLRLLPGLFDRSLVDMIMPYQNQIIILSGLFLLSFVVFATLSGRQITNNSALWTGSGCPECSERQLLRIHDRRIDRVLSLIFNLRFGRYICRNCDWVGRRIVGDYEWVPGKIISGGTQSMSELAAPADTSKPAGVTSLTIAMDPPQATNIVGNLDRQAFDAPVAVEIQAIGSAVMPAVGEQSLVSESIGEVGAFETWILDYGTRAFPVAIAYLVALTTAEVIAVLISPVTGVILHMVIMFVLIIHAALTWTIPIHRFLLALTLVPMIRVISLSLPLLEFPLMYWFFITSVPLLAAAYVIMRELDFTWGEVIGFRLRGLPVQLLIASTGFLFGYVEYVILEADPLVEVFSWQEILLPALILLISTGFLEEYIFRFLLQRTSIEQLGVAFGIIYVGLFFAILHIGYRSLADFIFVLLVGLFFGWAAHKTGSILGVTFAHGITNAMLFLVMPFLVLSGGSPIEDSLKSLQLGEFNQQAIVDYQIETSAELQELWEQVKEFPIIEQLTGLDSLDLDLRPESSGPPENNGSGGEN